MFGFFKSKATKQPVNSADAVAEALFNQITLAKDEAKSAGIITEDVFNDRLNHMYTAGYLIGYVDSALVDLQNDRDKKEISKRIFETMFPGSGFDFVRAKLIARKQVSTISEKSEGFREAMVDAQAFDQGMMLAQQEAEKNITDESSQPVGLKEFLLLGEVKS